MASFELIGGPKMNKDNRKIIRNHRNSNIKDNNFKEYLKMLIDEEIEKCYNDIEVEVISEINLGGYSNEN